MPLADLTAPEWGGIITAVGSALGVLVAAIFTGWKWLKVEDNKVLLQLEKARAATAKLEVVNRANNQAQQLKEKDEVIKLRSQEVHDLRGEVQTYMNRAAANEARLESCEKQLLEAKARLDDCENDRQQLWSAMAKLPPPA